MVTTQTFIQQAFVQEIAELEAEVGRVVALKTTPEPVGAALIERLDSVKAHAAMLCN
jgi:hypothetical protein